MKSFNILGTVSISYHTDTIKITSVFIACELETRVNQSLIMLRFFKIFTVGEIGTCLSTLMSIDTFKSIKLSKQFTENY